MRGGQTPAPKGPSQAIDTFRGLNQSFPMRLLIALLLPWLLFFTVGRPISGVICLILQITLVGWIPAAIWAVYSLSQFKTDRKIKKAMAGGGLASLGSDMDGVMGGSDSQSDSDGGDGGDGGD